MAASPSTSKVPVLYHVPRTISSPIYQILIELGLVSNSTVNVEVLSFPELKQAPYLKINPMGTSPSFVHDHPLGPVRMFESGAILSWILEEYDTQNRFHPAPGTSGRARFLFLQQYIVATVYPFLASLFLHTLRPVEEQDQTYVEEGKETFRTLLGPTLESFIDSDGYALGGMEPSAVDFLLAKPLGNAASMGLLAEFKVLSNIYMLVKERPSYSEAYGDTTKKSASRRNVLETRSLLLVPSTDN